MLRARKKAVRQPVRSSVKAVDSAHVEKLGDTGQDHSVDLKVERKVAAIRAIRDVEIEAFTSFIYQ
ncbi:hypothetical protein SAY86_007582 [Trapa natans]|uniref:Uncharacterized protein n=1 Tax=Trapa natans TaxID=22666 RepID=A0AAN7L8K4_TRANT|nr:hypothetical protein SAY86_007582 [Trapa natans]